ncbi:hypothetical protein V8F33_013007 [Rhypophila sp. PSN 637]
MDPSSHESNKGPRRRATSRSTGGGSGQQSHRPGEGGQSSGSAGPQEGPPRVETPAAGDTTLRAMSRLSSTTLSYIKDYLAGTAAVETSTAPTLPHTCGRDYKRVATPAVPPPSPGSLFTASGLLNRTMSTLGLTANPEDPKPLPCAACEAEKKAKMPYRPWTEAQSQEQYGLIHKGYEVLYRPGDPNRHGDPDHDSSESKKLRQVVPISDSEPSSPDVDSSESASDSEDDDDDVDANKKKSKRKEKGEGKRESEEKKRKDKKYSLIKNRDLSPESKVARRKSRRETKEMNATMDELDLEFKPSCPPGADLRRRRRDDDVTDDGDEGQEGKGERRKGG